MRLLTPLLMSLLLACPHITEAAETSGQKAVTQQRAANAALGAPGVKALAAQGVKLLDVRSDGEWKAGHIAGAEHAYWLSVAGKTEQLWPDKSTPIVTYCAVGVRARAAAARLRAAGYTHVLAMGDGGYEDLIKAGLAKAP